jgi:prepilin-type N-terminal cleavage/methylation domain-containing protein
VKRNCEAGSDGREGAATGKSRGARLARRRRAGHSCFGHSRPGHSRAGTTLVEMLVVITIAGVMVSIAVTTIHLLLRAEHEATNSARYAASVARLAHAFREDLHFAREFELPAAEPGKPAVLIARVETGRQIRYELDGHRATRIETSDTSDSRRDDFYFPPDSQLAFEREGELGVVRIAIKIPRGGNRAGGEQTAASAGPTERLSIEAAPGPVRRWKAFESEGEVTSE